MDYHMTASELAKRRATEPTSRRRRRRPPTEEQVRAEAEAIERQRAIERREQEQAQLVETEKQKQVDQDTVLVELAHIAFANIGDIMSIDAAGNIELDNEQLKDRLGPAINSLELVTTKKVVEADGESVTLDVTQKVKFTLHSKMKALDLLARHLGMLGNNTEDDFVREFLNAAKRRQEQVLKGDNKEIDHDG